MADIRFMRTGVGLLAALSLGLGLVAGGCSGSTTDDDGDDTTATGTSPTPTAVPEWEGVINFDGVAENDTIALKQDGTYDVKFTVTSQTPGFKFAAPGSCNGSHQCLHVHVLLDGTAGGDPYNAAGYTSPITADFSVLDDPTGKHNIKLQVVYDDHTPVASAGGEADVDVNVPSPTVKPTVVIVNPVANQTITLDASKKVTVGMKVTGYTLMDPGACGTTPNCGHIHILVANDDGSMCNASGAPYNNAGAGTTDDKGITTLDADLGLCTVSSGTKTISAQLVTDSHDPVQGPTAKASVSVSVLSSTDPSITITSPAGGDTVTLGSDGYKSVPIAFDVKNFTLKAPGDCGTDTNCGHVHLMIDGVAGNAAGGAPYNNAAAASPMDANFYWLDVNGFASVGVHQVTVQLFDDAHQPIKVNDVEVSSKITLTTQANANPAITITSPKSGTTARLGTDSLESVNVVYSVTNFTLMAPGECKGTANCGHIHLLIDDAKGNAPGAPYNNAGADPKTMPAYFKYLKDNTGSDIGDHIISLELHDDNHQPITFDTKDGDPITVAAFTHITTQAAPTTLK